MAEVANHRRLLDRPLEFTVRTKHASLRVSPSTTAEQLTRLEPDSVVLGFPDGDWLFIEKEEADEWIQSHRSASTAGAWVLLDGTSQGEGVLWPHWCTAAAISCKKGIEVFWPGLPEAGASYVVRWSAENEDGEEPATGECIAGLRPLVRIADTAEASGLHIQITACLPNGSRVHGPWIQPRLAEQGERRKWENDRAEKQEAPVDQITPTFTVSVSRHPASTVGAENLPKKMKVSGKRHKSVEQSMIVTKEDVYGEVCSKVFANSDSADLYAKSFRTQRDLHCPTLQSIPPSVAELDPPEAEAVRPGRQTTLGDVGSLDGLWIDSVGHRVATVHQDIVSFENGPSALLEKVGDAITVSLKDYGTLRATYDHAGKLLWSDGDAWTWAGDHAAKPNPQHGTSSDRSKRPHRVKIGSGGGAAGDSTDLLPERRKRGPQQFANTGNYYYTSDYQIEFMPSIAGAWEANLAMSWSNNWGAAQSVAPDEVPLVRMLVPDSNPRIFILELNSPRTSNMLDLVISRDFAMCFESVMDMMTRRNGYNNYPMSYVYQGSGPHFCPGGNPLPWNVAGQTPFEMISTHMATNVCTWNKLGIPGMAAIHGAAVGGGAAQTLNTNFRSLEARASVSFGNLSRGMVPIMLLSKHIPAIDYAGAVNYYLTDDTYAPITLYKISYCRQVIKGNQENKQAAVKFARRLATTACAGNLVKLRAPLDMHDHFAREVRGIFYATNNEGAAGAMQAVVDRAKAKMEEEAAEPEVKVMSDPKSDNILKCDVPTGKTILEMKQKIAEEWSLNIDDIMLMNGDQELKDSDVIPQKVKNGSIKLVLKSYDSTDYGDDYDYDEDYDYDYDYDEEDWE